MTTPAAPTKNQTQQGRVKGSLTSTLVRTLLIFTFIPLALMASVAYFRARSLLREQAVSQLDSLITNQMAVVGQDVVAKEMFLKGKLEETDTAGLVIAALNEDTQSSQLSIIRRDLIDTLTEEPSKSFDDFFIVDKDGVIHLATNIEWQGVILDPAFFNFAGQQSKLLQGLAPIFENEPLLITTVNINSDGVFVGITHGKDLQDLLQPLNGLAPYATSYFIVSGDQIITTDTSTGSLSPATVTDTAKAQFQKDLETLKIDNAEASRTLDMELSEGEKVLAQTKWASFIQTGVVLAVKSDIIFANINSLTPFTILLVVGSILAMSVFLFYGTNRVVKPLNTLSEMARRFAEGDRSLRAQSTDINNEIGQLSRSFNYLADQIEDSYKSLEKKVEERTLQIRTAAEVAQSVTTIPNLDEMLSRTAELLVQQFDFYQTTIFLVNRNGKSVDFKTGYGSATKGLAEKKYSLPIGSSSIVSWVAANNKVRVASDTLEDDLHLQNEFLPESHSEACVPISLGDQVLGVLDVQSTQPVVFSTDTIMMLKTLASQIATAIQTSGLVASSQVNFQELDRLYRSSRLIEAAKDEGEILRVGGQVLKSAPYPIVFLQATSDSLKVISVSETLRNDFPTELTQNLQADVQELNSFLMRGSVTASSTSLDLYKPIKNILRSLELLNAVVIPVKGQEEVKAVLIVGSRSEIPSSSMVQPYENLADLMSVAIQRASAFVQTERHLQEVETLASMNELIASTSDIQEFFHALHAKIQQIIGDYSLIVAIYDEPTNSISIPFSYEAGKYQSIPTFPLGEGLTSILIRTRQPLMLVKDTERRTAELGAKVVGKPAKSWMGAPLILQNSVIGALIIQDGENEGSFNENDLKFFTTIASQVAGVIKNVQLLEESKQKALQIETAAEIARDISGSLNLDELLNKAINLIRDRFNFYHAGIFLLDIPGEFAIIREATGESGAQLKRQNYKIGVGSKSIVGYVTGKGETLVVSDTTKDMTYYPNPLLPETRAEAAFPLRVGERILGALDVQSTQPYAFHEDNLRSLQILTDQLAIAVANTELFAETQEHLSQHRLLHHITSSAASGTTLEEALESAVSGLQVTLGGDRVMIFLIDREKRLLEVKASIGYSEDISSMTVEVGKGVTGWVAAHRRPLRVRDVREDSRYIETSPNTRSEMAIPLIYRNEILGVINVESEQVDAYSENDEEMLGTLGGSLAAVIANARLVEQIRAQSERERLINEITARIRRSTDIQSILHTTASEISRVTGARYTKIQVDPKSGDTSSEERQ